MKVYAFRPAEGRQIVVPAPATGTLLEDAAGVRQGPAWRPVAVELVSEEQGRARLAVDAPFLLSALPVVKTAALPRVRDDLAPYAEFLPLDCPQEPLTAINALNVVDALDEEASEVRRFSGSGRVMAVRTLVFQPDRLPVVGLFKIPQTMAQTTYATEATARLLSERLTGFNLREVWST